MMYYKEDNGDYLAVDPTTLSYYTTNFGRLEYEGRGSAIHGQAGSVQTTVVSKAYLEEHCTRIRKRDVPKDWLKYIG
jgi:hypothetical protein